MTLITIHSTLVDGKKCFNLGRRSMFIFMSDTNVYFIKKKKKGQRTRQFVFLCITIKIKIRLNRFRLTMTSTKLTGLYVLFLLYVF